MWWKKVDMNTIKNSCFPVTTTNFRQHENKNQREKKVKAKQLFHSDFLEDHNRAYNVISLLPIPSEHSTVDHIFYVLQDFNEVQYELLITIYLCTTWIMWKKTKSSKALIVSFSRSSPDKVQNNRVKGNGLNNDGLKSLVCVHCVHKLLHWDLGKPVDLLKSLRLFKCS